MEVTTIRKEVVKTDQKELFKQLLDKYPTIMVNTPTQAELEDLLNNYGYKEFKYINYIGRSDLDKIAIEHQVIFGAMNTSSLAAYEELLHQLDGTDKKLFMQPYFAIVDYESKDRIYINFIEGSEIITLKDLEDDKAPKDLQLELSKRGINLN